jgi:hypothetical protein
MCLFFIVLLAGPRIGGLFWWLFAPTRWDTAFSNVLWPIFGLIFAPWTTLMWVAVAPLGTATGADWIWIAFGAAADLFSFLSSGYGNRTRVPGYTRY